MNLALPSISFINACSAYPLLPIMSTIFFGMFMTFPTVREGLHLQLPDVKNLVYRKLAKQPSPNGGIWNAEFLTPLRYGLGFIIERKQNIAAKIVLLFRMRSPADISRFIPFFIVDSINSVQRGWPFSDMRKKGGERSKPFCANVDASPPVIGIKPRFRIATALFNTAPHRVFRALAMAVHVFSGNASFSAFNRTFRAQASTRSNLSMAQVIFTDLLDSAASTLAYKISNAFRLGNNFQASNRSSEQLIVPLFGSVPILNY